jgi:hypothetical protein
MLGAQTWLQLLNELYLKVRSRLPPAAHGLVLVYAAVLRALEVLPAFPIHTDIVHTHLA